MLDTLRNRLFPDKRDQAIHQKVEDLLHMRSSARSKHENPEELKAYRADIRTKIHELRAETQHRTIQLQNKFFLLLEENPDITRDQLKEAFREDQLSRSELKILLSISHEFHTRRERSRAVLNKFMRQAQRNLGLKGEVSNEEKSKLEVEAAKLFFVEITKKQPTGKIALIDTPFAVGLQLYSEEDFASLRKNGNPESGGFYEDKRKLLFNIQDVDFSKPIHALKILFDYDSFPFIASLGGNLISEKHEAGHGENATIVEGLENVKVVNTQHWEKASVNKLDPEALKEKLAFFRINSKRITELEKQAELNEKLYLDLKNLLRPVFRNSFDRAKDEVVTDFLAKNDLSYLDNLLHDRQFNPQVVTRKNHLYQYLQQNGFVPEKFQSDPNLQKIYDRVIDDYNAQLKKNIGAVKEYFDLVSSTTDYKTTSERAKDLVAFMRQNPLEQWAQKIKDLFTEERAKLEKIKSTQDKLKATVDPTIDAIRKMQKHIQDDANVTYYRQKNPAYETQVSSILNQCDARAHHLLELRNEMTKKGTKVNPEGQELAELLAHKYQKEFTEDFKPRFEKLIQEAEQALQTLVHEHPLAKLEALKDAVRALDKQVHALSSIPQQNIEIFTSQVLSRFPQPVEPSDNELQKKTVNNYIWNYLFNDEEPSSITDFVDKSTRGRFGISSLQNEESQKQITQFIESNLPELRLQREVIQKQKDEVTAMQQAFSAKTDVFWNVVNNMREKNIEQAINNDPANALEKMDRLFSSLPPSEQQEIQNMEKFLQEEKEEVLIHPHLPLAL